MVAIIDNPALAALYARRAASAQQASPQEDIAAQPTASVPAYPAKTLILDAGRYRVSDVEK